MSKVEFTYRKSGKTVEMSEVHARILSKVGYGKYMNRMMTTEQGVELPKRRGRPPKAHPVFLDPPQDEKVKE